MLNLLLKPLFWVLVIGAVGGGFLVFRIGQIQATIDCGPGKVLQGIFPTICVDLSRASGSLAIPSSSGFSGATGGDAGGTAGSAYSKEPGCTGNVGATGPGLTTGTAICGVICPAGRPAKITHYTGSGTPVVGYDQAQGKYICNGKPTLGPSSIQCECQ